MSRDGDSEEGGAAGRGRAVGEDLAAEEVAPGLYRLPLEIPFDVGPVNCYLLLRGDEPVLVDTGPKTDSAYEALLAHLAGLGLAPGDLRHIVVTHAHIDHHGNLARLVAASGAAVYCHEADARAVFDFHDDLRQSCAAVREVLRFWGYPAEVLPKLEAYRMRFARYADPVDRRHLRVIRGEEQPLRPGGVAMRAIHCPGHCAGMIALLLDDPPGTLLASDHILEHITPNPTVYLEPYRGRRTGLADYVASLRRLRPLPVTRILPGHGPPFTGLQARIDTILAHHELRAEKVLGLLRGGPRTVLELIGGLWPGLAKDQHYLACREVHGHLDILEEAGRVRHAVGPDGAARYETTAGPPRP